MVVIFPMTMLTDSVFCWSKFVVGTTQATPYRCNIVGLMMYRNLVKNCRLPGWYRGIYWFWYFWCKHSRAIVL